MDGNLFTFEEAQSTSHLVPTPIAGEASETPLLQKKYWNDETDPAAGMTCESQSETGNAVTSSREGEEGNGSQTERCGVEGGDDERWS